MGVSVTKLQIQDELRRQLQAQAIEQALSGRWDEAVQTNRHIVDLFPDDYRARNRLGNAYTQLGSYDEALGTYEECLRLQPSNTIARKKTTELYALLRREPPGPLSSMGSGLEASDDEDDLVDEAEDLTELYEDDEDVDSAAEDEGD